MRNVYLVEIMNKRDLVVKLENRMKNSKLLAKNFEFCYILTLSQTPASLKSYTRYVGLVLLSTFVLRVC